MNTYAAYHVLYGGVDPSGQERKLINKTSISKTFNIRGPKSGRSITVPLPYGAKSRLTFEDNGISLSLTGELREECDTDTGEEVTVIEGRLSLKFWSSNTLAIGWHFNKSRWGFRVQGFAGLKLTPEMEGEGKGTLKYDSGTGYFSASASGSYGGSMKGWLGIEGSAKYKKYRAGLSGGGWLKGGARGTLELSCNKETCTFNYGASFYLKGGVDATAYAKVWGFNVSKTWSLGSFNLQSDKYTMPGHDFANPFKSLLE